MTQVIRRSPLPSITHWQGRPNDLQDLVEKANWRSSHSFSQKNGALSTISKQMSTLSQRYKKAMGSRKRAASSSVDDRKIAKIAKQVVLRNQETKYLVYETLSAATSTNPVTYNVMHFGAVRGTTENTFIGERFHLTGIAAKVFGNNNNAPGLTIPGTPNKVPLFVKVMIVAAKDFATVSSLTATQLCDESFTNRAQLMYIDPNKCRVLASSSYEIKPDFLDGVNGQFQWASAECYADIKKDVSFRNWSTSTELKDWNYYVIHWANISSCPIQVTFKAYIKDA